MYSPPWIVIITAVANSSYLRLVTIGVHTKRKSKLIKVASLATELIKGSRRPEPVRHHDDFANFKTALKTHLFREHFN